MAKKKRSSTPEAQNPHQQPIKGKMNFYYLPIFLTTLIAVGYNYYIHSIDPTETINLTTSDVDVDALSYKIVTRVSNHPDYDSNGYFLDRIMPEVQIMTDTPENRAEYEVHNPENLPFVTYLPGPPMGERRERAMGARFRSFCNFPVTMWWDDGTGQGVFSGVIPALADTSTNTYTTHAFVFRKQDSDEVVARITMVEDRHLYFIGPMSDDITTKNSERYKETLKEVAYMENYYKEHGYPWLSYYPRDKPILYMYPTDFVGQIHKVRSFYGYTNNKGIQSKDPIDFEILVASTQPKVLIIRNLLSEYEIKHIVSMGEKVVKQSKVGNAGNGFTSKTRTSENGWLQRSDSTVLNNVYYRLGDLLRMTDQQLRDDGGKDGCAENLQFVRYLESQRYDPHHDFGHSGHVEQRFSTMLIYLEVPEEGGGTSFPKAFNGQGIAVKPEAGDAVLFYSMMPDGNGDDYSLHSGMPVTKGRKYVCNLWSWDPKRSF